MGEQTWLWLDAVLMLAGGLLILAIGKRRVPQEQSHTIYHGVVCIIAACSYFAMASGQGSIVLPLGAAPGTGRLFYFARYIDWSITTPLLLLALAGTAMHSGLRRRGLVAGLLLADVMMILTALFFGATDTPWIKWTWFAISCVAFLAVYYVIWLPMLQENRQEIAEARSDYVKNAAMLTVLWMVYPLVLAVSTDGLGLIGSATGVALIAVIDLTSKVAYGLYTTLSTTRLVDHDLAASSARAAHSVAV